MKRMMMLFLVLVIASALVGCAGMTRSEQRTLSGAAIGAGGGALIGGILGGRPLTGAAIGAGIGALGGYVADEYDDDGYYRHRRRR
jgi:osmotically inducible lipoprotein OsmB